PAARSRPRGGASGPAPPAPGHRRRPSPGPVSGRRPSGAGGPRDRRARRAGGALRPRASPPAGRARPRSPRPRGCGPSGPPGGAAGRSPQYAGSGSPRPGVSSATFSDPRPVQGIFPGAVTSCSSGVERPARRTPWPADAQRHRPSARETRPLPTAERGRALSPLSFALILLAAALAVASVAGIYISNVTAKPGGIPRWVVYLFIATLEVGLAAVLSLA